MSNKKFKFELNSAGVRELLNSNNMKSVLSKYASDVQSRAGSGYTTSVINVSDRAKAFVHTSTKSAQRDNLKNNTLLKALGSMKG